MRRFWDFINGFTLGLILGPVAFGLFAYLIGSLHTYNNRLWCIW